VEQYPSLAAEFSISTDEWKNNQLPTLICFHKGKEVCRLPMLSSQGKVTNSTHKYTHLVTLFLKLVFELMLFIYICVLKCLQCSHEMHGAILNFYIYNHNACTFIYQVVECSFAEHEVVQVFGLNNLDYGPSNKKD
jgi:hypothetical protein